MKMLARAAFSAYKEKEKYESHQPKKLRMGRKAYSSTVTKAFLQLRSSRSVSASVGMTVGATVCLAFEGWPEPDFRFPLSPTTGVRNSFALENSPQTRAIMAAFHGQTTQL